MGFTGLPMNGQSFDLTLRDAETGFALLAVGLSDTMSLLGPLPVNLSTLFPIVTSGCVLFVSGGLLPRNLLTMVDYALAQFLWDTNSDHTWVPYSLIIGFLLSLYTTFATV